MNLRDKNNGLKGAAGLFYIAIGISATIGALDAIHLHQDRSPDITIHMPKVEVR
jgi:hypothetical protein